MKRSDHDDLLRDLFAGSGDLEALATSALAAAAERRRLRRSAKRSLALVTLALVISALVSYTIHQKLTSRMVAAVPVPDPLPASNAPGQVRIISEEELLDYFPDRVVALVGPAGNRRLVFLDDPTAASSRSTPN